MWAPCILSKKKTTYYRKNRDAPRGVLLLLASRLDGLHTFGGPKCDIYENSSLVYAVCLLLTCRKTVILLFGRPGALWGSPLLGAWVRVLPSGVTFGSRGLLLSSAADYRESLVSCTREAYFRLPRGCPGAPWRSFFLARIGA